ncbi:MAG: threonine--tRNA ligase [Patescibacteria group bacterium]
MQNENKNKTEENKLDKNDHRVLGQELDLFTFSDLVGPGLPLWTPKGTILREEINNFVQDLRKKDGYQKVAIPHITKIDLYKKSGHWDKFSEELFQIKTREGKEYAMKPMSCPHHTQIFARKIHSYREMPQRYSETTMVYRDEQSGELSGLSRVISITQDDAHVFCRRNQIKEEILKIWNIINIFYKTLGFDLKKVRLSFRDPIDMKKYLGTPEIWDEAEKILRELVVEQKINYFEGPGEAALYGPKLDFMAETVTGREIQIATIQLDLNLPERFDLTCVNENGENERIAMIHAAITGSLERCASLLIEHFAGAFPLWLSPVQIKILPISAEKHLAYAEEIFKFLKETIRVELDDSNESLGKKIRNAKIQKIPYLIVIGDKENESKTLTIETRAGEKIENITIENLLQKLQKEISDKI